jgi:hypothetical protein
MIRTNTLKELRVTRERKVRIISNTNDTYEYIEGATSNQRKKGTNYNKYQWYVRIHWRATSNQRKKGTNYNKYKWCVRIHRSKVLRVTRERKVRIITNTNDTYEYIKGATSNQRKEGTNYNKYQWYVRIHRRSYE